MTIETIYILFFFILGTVMGSFYNVVGCRLPNGESLVTPPSHCPNCNHRLGFFELFPILSYLFQGGKCKHCKVKISFIYPLFELLTGILFALSYFIFGLTPELLVALTFVSTLLIVIISDFKYMIIPDELILFSLVMLIMQKLFIGVPVLEMTLDIVIPFVVLLLVKIFGDFVFKKESLGGGDIKLMSIFGIVIGFENAILSVGLASFIALPTALLMLLIKKNGMIPFGPYLSIAALLMYYLSIDYTNVLNWLINLS